jgi:hypothetical protein
MTVGASESRRMRELGESTEKPQEKAGELDEDEWIAGVSSCRNIK